MKKTVITMVSILLIVAFSLFTFTGCSRETSKYVSFTMKVKKDGTFKILQLTDIHFINSDVKDSRSVQKSYCYRDEWAQTVITDLVERAKPDMIMVTGDSVFTLNSTIQYTGTNDNEAAFRKFARFIDSFKIPWAFLFGNHDEEGSLHSMLGDVDEVKSELGMILRSDEIKYCMYTDGPEDINGIGNYIINIVNRDGSTNTPLVLFDSGSYLKNIVNEKDGQAYADQRAYEYVHDDQLDWYEKAINDISRIEKKKVDSIVFQHIPFPEYAKVIDSYIDALEALGENWEDTINVNWEFGKTRTLDTKVGEITYHGGIYGDKEVACSFVGQFQVGEFYGPTFDGGHEFERLLSLGSTKYVFCGHDHRNNFSFTYKGIRLTYGMSIDYSANGIVSPPVSYTQTIFDETEQRGGTLITIGKDSSVSIEQLPFTRNLYRETMEELHLKK